MTMELVIITDYLRAVMGNLAVPYMTSELAKMKQDPSWANTDKNTYPILLLDQRSDLVVQDIRRLLTKIDAVLTTMIGPSRSNQLLMRIKHDLLETGMNT